MKKIYRGLIAQIADKEGYRAIHVIIDGQSEYPFVEQVRNDLGLDYSKQVSLYYIASDKEIPEEEIQLETMKFFEGVGNTKYGAYYSDVTGYLWTNEDFKIGGHDIVGELRSYIGKYLHMEIEVHNNKRK